MSSNSARQRKWLREASMRRLSQLVKDKTEMIDSAQKLRINISSVDGLEASGLNKQMIQHLENWVEGNMQLYFIIEDRSVNLIITHSF